MNMAPPSAFICRLTLKTEYHRPWCQIYTATLLPMPRSITSVLPPLFAKYSVLIHAFLVPQESYDLIGHFLWAADVAQRVLAILLRPMQACGVPIKGVDQVCFLDPSCKCSGWKLTAF